MLIFWQECTEVAWNVHNNSFKQSFKFHLKIANLIFCCKLLEYMYHIYSIFTLLSRPDLLVRSDVAKPSMPCSDLLLYTLNCSGVVSKDLVESTLALLSSASLNIWSTVIVLNKVLGIIVWFIVRTPQWSQKIILFEHFIIYLWRITF